MYEGASFASGENKHVLTKKNIKVETIPRWMITLIITYESGVGVTTIASDLVPNGPTADSASILRGKTQAVVLCTGTWCFPCMTSEHTAEICSMLPSSSWVHSGCTLVRMCGQLFLFFCRLVHGVFGVSLCRRALIVRRLRPVVHHLLPRRHRHQGNRHLPGHHRR